MGERVVRIGQKKNSGHDGIGKERRGLREGFE